MYQLLKSLDHMHRNGIFHRDIKPGTRVDSNHSVICELIMDGFWRNRKHPLDGRQAQAGGFRIMSWHLLQAAIH
jgi:hypothetical protein